MIFLLFGCLYACVSTRYKTEITYLDYRYESAKKREASQFSVEVWQDSVLTRRYHRLVSGKHYLTRQFIPKAGRLHCILEERFYPDGTLQYQYTLKGEGYQIGPQQEWHPNGQLKQEYLSPGQEGYWRRWYPNGQLQLRFHYRKGVRHGWQSYWKEDGTLLYQCYEGEFVEGDPGLEIFDRPFLGAQTSQESFDRKPHLSNRVCEGDLLEFSYPKIAREVGIMGRCKVWVYVDEMGQVLDYEIKQSIHPILDISVIRRLFNCEYPPEITAQKPTAGWGLEQFRFSTPY